MTGNDLVRKLSKDFYEVLGLTSPSTAEEIKKQYRLLALKLHPDKNRNDPEAEAKFKEVSEAYAILGDELNKKTYDEMRRLMRNGFTSFHAHAQNQQQQPDGENIYCNGNAFGQVIHNNDGGGGGGNASMPFTSAFMAQNFSHQPVFNNENFSHGGHAIHHVHNMHGSNGDTQYVTQLQNGCPSNSSSGFSTISNHGDPSHQFQFQHLSFPSHTHTCACCSSPGGYRFANTNNSCNGQQSPGRWMGVNVRFEPPTYVEEAPVLFDVTVTLKEVFTGATKRVQVMRNFVNPYTSVLMQEERVMLVTVPKGAKQGQMVGWSKEGDGSGHYIFIVSVANHPLFVRDGDNLVLKILRESINKEKEKIKVDAIDGESVDLVVQQLRKEPLVILGRGLPRYDQPDVRGDFIVSLEGPPPLPPRSTMRRTLSKISKRLTAEKIFSD